MGPFGARSFITLTHDLRAWTINIPPFGLVCDDGYTLGRTVIFTAPIVTT